MRIHNMPSYIVCAHWGRLDEAILVRTNNTPSCWRGCLCCVSWPGDGISPHLLELPMSRTGFHGPIGVRAIEVRLYITNSFQSVSALLSPRRSYSITYEKPLYMF